jgi:site-specific recombinase XerD
MLQDLEAGGYAEGTRVAYIAAARDFIAFYRRPAEEMGQEEVRQYLSYLRAVRQFSDGRMKQCLAGLKFLFARTLGRPEVVSFIRFRKGASRLPTVLGMSEVTALLNALEKPKYRIATTTMYATGMRVSEVCRMQTTDIDADRGVIRVLGKGNKERLVMMSPRLLLTLRTYWKQERPAAPHMFTGESGQRLNPNTLREAMAKATAQAGIGKHVTPHVLRHYTDPRIIPNGWGFGFPVSCRAVADAG